MFAAKNGVASSIMDYARFNYVLQPKDGISPIDFRLGPYDKFAIEWSYREFSGAEEEIPQQIKSLTYSLKIRRSDGIFIQTVRALIRAFKPKISAMMPSMRRD